MHQDIEYVEVASSIASRSAGPATRANLDEYIETTEEALQRFSGARRAKAILILNPANPPIDMQTTIYAKIANPDLPAIRASVEAMVAQLKTYVPGYGLVVPPTIEGGRVVTTIKVVGAGDYLPQYAGNLDIINAPPSRWRKWSPPQGMASKASTPRSASMGKKILITDPTLRDGNHGLCATATTPCATS